ncbi:HGxxPAAW family protein [Streptomyces solincola]|uniref:HGxxPAAW family protein n=1 Tax=Streptomyces solincola TaxID=2100817 RepID=UPI00215939A6|nr:HGxxPAAW family protein [Streptomyces solincola]
MGMHGDADLGHTVAGWTGTAVAAAGFAVLGSGLIAASPVLLAAGGAVLAAAAAVTWLLHLAGWGKPSGPRPPAQQPWRTRDHSARTGHPGCLGCRLAGRVPKTARTEMPGARTAFAGTAGVPAPAAEAADPA